MFDVDEFDVAHAIGEAQRLGVEVAVSNPCFELWLILHFRRHTAYAAAYRDLLPHLKRHLPVYDKTRLNFRDFEDGWRQAVPRAKELTPAGREHKTNPATGVWALVDRIAGV